MRYAILADIHGNILALNAAIEDMQRFGGVEVILSLGDMIGYGPWPREVIETLRANGAILLQGNHEHAVSNMDLARRRTNNADTLKMLEFTQNQFNDAEIRELGELPLRQQNAAFQSAHCALINTNEWPYLHPDSFETLLQLRLSKQPLSFIGHTHRASFVRFNLKKQTNEYRDNPQIMCLPLEEGYRYLINPGSIGQPRDNDPRAAYVILDIVAPGESRVYFRRVPYDRETTIRHMRTRRLPECFMAKLRASE